MAKLKEDMVLIKISRLLGNDESESDLIDETVLEQLIVLFNELAGPKSIVEIEKLDSAK
jgi:hypothetical protein